MKRLLTKGIFVFGVAFTLSLFSELKATAALISWTNIAGGSWFNPLNWSPNSVPGSSDAAFITNNGTYTVIAPTGTVTTAVFTIGGGSGKQTFIYGSSPTQLLTNSVIQNNGVLLVTNGGLTGNLLIQPGGELQLNAPSLFLYNFALTNRGTVTWSNGSLALGGSNNETTYMTNSGLWQIACDANMNYGGGSTPMFINSGTLQKVNGPGSTTLNLTLINLPSGSVNVSSGTLQLAAFTTNVLGGSFVTTSPGTLTLRNNQTDAGGVGSGSGTFQMVNGTLYLRTNTIPQLKMLSGEVYITGTTTFQQAGAITNMTLEGAALRGTNRVAGTLTLNGGNIIDVLTVLPGGQLAMISPSGAQLYGCNLVNQGTVTWSGAALAVGGTPGTVISNGGTWTITSDAAVNFGGGSTAYFTNSGTLQKTGGSGSTDLLGFTLINRPSGIVTVTTGTLRLPNSYTNAAGELRLNGGTFATFLSSTIGMTGGVMDGSGSINSTAAFDNGTVSPGLAGVGLMQFKSGLTLGTNLTLSLDGTGTVPGVSYDQISVAGGTLAISNATLQVTSLPSVAVGTTFVIITNTSGSPTVGTFNGLAENAQLTISAQPFRIHYSGGDGNDVVLVRDSGGAPTGPQLSSGGYTNKTFKLSGAGSGSTIYTIQASTNFLQWTNVGTATGDVSGNFFFTDTNATNFHYRFYRTTN